MQNNEQSTKSKRNVFSNFVYKTNKFKKDFQSLSFVNDTSSSSRTISARGQDISTQTNFKSSTQIDLKFTSVRKTGIFKESCTQTSKTVIAIPRADIGEPHRLSPDSLSPKKEASTNCDCKSIIDLDYVSVDRENNVSQYCNHCERQGKNLMTGDALTKTYLAKNKYKLESNSQSWIPCDHQNELKSQSFVDTSAYTSTRTKRSRTPRFKATTIREKIGDHIENVQCVNFVTTQTKLNITGNFPCISNANKAHLNPVDKDHAHPVQEKEEKFKKSLSFMSPTISSERKDQRLEIENIKKLISPTRRGRSNSPNICDMEKKEKSVPYIDTSNITIKGGTEMSPVRKNSNSQITCTTSAVSGNSTDCALHQAVAKLKDGDWNVALRGLAEIIEICRVLDAETIFPHMSIINQRLIELLRSPRSHVCRTACQAVGHLFEYVKDTRRPEFDELIDTLLAKTADSNKFIRHDANLALDCMVTHIPTFHAVRALCSKGPEHKNSLVRTATSRLLVCAVVIAGPQNLLHPNSNEFTRKRVILNMVKFVDDRCQDIRKYGERIYKLLCKDRIFDIYLRRYLEPDIIVKMKQCLQHPNGQKF